MVTITDISETKDKDIALDEDDCDRLELGVLEVNNEVAESVANWLISKYRSKMIFNCIDEVFGSMESFEKDAVYSSVCDIISGKYRVEHLEYIKSKVTDFFENEETMNIDGFINFRLKAYKAELKTLVEECGYDILAYRDYCDMIDVINFLFDTTDYEF